MIDTKIKCLITQAQKNEITEHFVYEKLATATKDKKNFEVLHQIAHDELNHYQFWQKYSDKQITPNWFKVWRYFLMAKILGLSFFFHAFHKFTFCFYTTTVPFLPRSLL